ncbi:MAG: hypothetical protein HXX15_08740 [Rhodopseudomonas sp.]|uniref:hypothetical protein n=1 Tax=Rhodopseudomonas sp. TaxID=1078 RepID=UPI0017C74FD4|nr:hypothetical protein [Rhodopseudomonas sp.]NVN86165.1 hypothetical protein [Rhodopseudomonas sp.]
MKRLIGAAGVLILLGGAAAIAQSGTMNWPNSEPSNPPIKPSSTQGRTVIPAAPVGHRQPRPTAAETADAKALNKLDAEDALLDRKIKGICRGC